MDICSITVTYGRRFHFVQGLIQALRREGIQNIVVVNNGCPKNVEEKLVEYCRDEQVILKTLDQNLGAAKGFKEGLLAALETSASFFWLLDDDNLLEPGILKKVTTYWETYQKIDKPSKTAFFCYREDQFQHKFLQRAGNGLSILPPVNAFLGFHIKKIFELVRHRSSKKKVKQTLFDEVQMIPTDAAFYGGLYIHRKLLEDIKLPNESYYFYADDWEFTNQVIKKGGEIFLLSNCVVKDQSTSANFSKRKNLFYHIIFEFDTDERAYYYARNVSFFEQHHRLVSPWMRMLNKWSVLGILLLFSLFNGQFKRFKIVLSALGDAQKNRMGKNPVYSSH